MDWMHGPFAMLDAEKVDTSVSQWWLLVQKLQRVMKQLPAPFSALGEIKKKVEFIFVILTPQ